MKLFLLDSNKKILSNLTAYFGEKNDFEIVGAADNGIDGLNGIIDTKPDVIIMDLILSGMDGFAVLNNLGETDSRIIVTTAMCSDEIVTRAFSMGVGYVMIKPYDFDNLYTRIIDIMTPVDEGARVFENPAGVAHTSGAADTKRMITKLLHDIGITPNLKGFRYLRSAVTMVLEDEAVIEAVTKIIYPEIAKEYKTTPVRAERAIRHAIETAWERDNGENIKRVFKLPASTKRPTNSEFIGLSSEYLKK